MAVLVDTNILLRSAQPHHPHFSLAKGALAALRRDREQLNVAVQNLVEFWVVGTRPEQVNGLGMNIERVVAELETLRSRFRVLPESDLVFPTWEFLVTRYRISGKNAHDAHLVAVMNVNRVDKILTFDTADFTRFQEIQVLDPHSIR